MPIDLFSRENVLRKLAIVFPDSALAERALQSLDGQGMKRLLPGVQLAILKLCGGNLPRLRRLVREANRDFRDVLYLAQSPEWVRAMQDKPWILGGMDSRSGRGGQTHKKLSAEEEAAIRMRDSQQWSAWLIAD